MSKKKKTETPVVVENPDNLPSALFDDAKIDIKGLIHIIRGQKVMIDRDLAKLYGVETKRLNEVVKRNLKRFEGDDFMFRLTKDETDYARSRSQIATLNNGGSTDPSSLRSQFATSNKGRGGVRYLPYAFTELGVAMLSSVLTSETAISINDINETTRAQLDAISSALAELQSERSKSAKRNPIGFNAPKQ